MEQKKIRAMVAGGGGSLGSVWVGWLSVVKPKYNLLIGVSTGILIALLSSMKRYNDLVIAYTSVTQPDIFNVNPFKPDGKIKIWNAIWRIMRFKLTLGETKPLRDLIQVFFTERDFEKIRSTYGEIDIIAVTSRISGSKGDPRTTHWSIHQPDMTYDKWIDCVWASCNVPLVMSVVEIDGEQHVDGGLTEAVALTYAVNYHGVGEIDVFVNKVKKDEEMQSKVTNFFWKALRLFGIMRDEIERDDVSETVKALAKERGIVVNEYYHAKKLGHPLVFGEHMNGYVKLGVEMANGLNK